MSFDIDAAYEAAIEKHAVELERIKGLTDFEEQGYCIAPIICEVADCTPWQLLDSTLVEFGTDPEDAERDNGVIRWCNDQIKLGEES